MDIRERKTYKLVSAEKTKDRADVGKRRAEVRNYAEVTSPSFIQ
jgi:hypothetical protein